MGFLWLSEWMSCVLIVDDYEFDEKFGVVLDDLWVRVGLSKLEFFRGFFCVWV